jgi:hypothetical protein
VIILLTVIFILLALSDFPKLISDRKWYEVTILSGFYICVFTLAALMTFGVTLPSPVKGIERFITDVLHLSYPKL